MAGEPPSLSTFGQALADLGMIHIEALSPKPKDGSNGSGKPEANRVLPELIAKHNRQFAVAPQNAEPAYRPLPETPLEHIFTRRQYRRISGGQTFSWKGKCYMPKPVPGVPRWEAKSVVEVRVGMDGQVWLWDQGRAWPCVETQATQTPAPSTAKKEAAHASSRKPAANHPWRKSFSGKQLQRSTASG